MRENNSWAGITDMEKIKKQIDFGDKVKISYTWDAINFYLDGKCLGSVSKYNQRISKMPVV